MINHKSLINQFFILSYQYIRLNPNFLPLLYVVLFCGTLKGNWPLFNQKYENQNGSKLDFQLTWLKNIRPTEKLINPFKNFQHAHYIKYVLIHSLVMQRYFCLLQTIYCMSIYTMSLIYFINLEIYKDIAKQSKYDGMLQAIKC